MTGPNANDDEFDARMRAVLRTLPVPNDAYVSLPRRSFLQLGIGVLSLTALGAAGWYTQQSLGTPPFVRHAFAHVSEESGLRGVLVPDLPAVNALLGRPLPGVLQLCKECVVDGYRVWHVLSYLDNLGYVSVLAFRGRAPSLSGAGHWLHGHWQVVRTQEDNPLLVLSPQQAALEVVVNQLQS